MAAILLLNHAMQSALLPYFAIFGVTPDTSLILICSYAILRGDISGAIFGFCAGLLRDLYGDVLGLHALVGMLVGYCCGKPFKGAMPLALVPVAALCSQMIFYVSRFMLRGRTDFMYFARTIILPKTVYTILLAVPLYITVYTVNRHIEQYELTHRRFFTKKDMKDE